MQERGSGEVARLGAGLEALARRIILLFHSSLSGIVHISEAADLLKATMRSDIGSTMERGLDKSKPLGDSSSRLAPSWILGDSGAARDSLTSLLDENEPLGDHNVARALLTPTLSESGPQRVYTAAGPAAGQQGGAQAAGQLHQLKVLG